MRITTSILTSFLLISSAAAQGAWIQLQPTTSPPARGMGGFAAMLQQNKCVLFGGEVDVNSSTLNDTWTWDGVNWTQLLITGPQPLEGFVMTYDAIRDRVLLFSGWNGGSYVPETWEFDGTTWAQLGPAVTPPGRDWSAGAFDFGRANTVIFGGHDWQVAGNLGDTWTWDGTNWTQHTVTGPPNRWGHAMVYDPARGTVILFGGTGVGNDMWEWDGTAWSQITPNTVPPARQWHKMVWDPNRNRVVMFGGFSAGAAVNDVWEWDGTDWQQATVVGTAPGGGYLVGADFDPVLNNIVQFGGFSAPGRLASTNETWMLTPNATGFATVQAYGSGCGGVSDFASYYEEFSATTFDLGGAAGAENVYRHTFIGNGHLVLPGMTGWFAPVAPDLGLGDDGVTGPLPLGFTLTLASGAQTTDVWVCSNGFIWMTGTGTGDFSPSVAEFLAQGERLAPYWTDLRPGTGGGSGTIHFDPDPANNVAYVTWLAVNEFSAGGNITMQVAIHAAGDIEYRYGAETMSTSGTQGSLVGMTPGNGALDPGASDISATGTMPIITQPDQFRLDMSVSSGRPVEGSTMNVTIDNMPTGSLFGAFALSGRQVVPGVQPIAGLDNCVLLIGNLSPVYFIPTGSTHSLSVTVPVGTFTGATFYTQALVLAPGINAAGVASSNGLTWVVNVN